MVREQEVLQALEQVLDPEVGLNVVELGLVYGVRIDGARVAVDLTMTTPGCPLDQVLTQAAAEAIERVPGVERAQVNLVWDPPWTPERLSAQAKRKLGR